VKLAKFVGSTNQKTRWGRKGFTLVEIMIVVLIIGILLAIAVPNFIKARETSRAKSCVANLKQIDAAKEQWAMDNRAAATATAPGLTTLVGTDAYIKNTPQCPSGGTYTVGGTGGTIASSPTCSVGGTGATAHALP
jgi:prepilin-type N-terminal cleavage/methylation domain-containing protein